MKTAALNDLVDLEFGYPFKSSGFNTEARGLPIVRIRDVASGTSATYYDGDFEPRYLVTDGDLLIGMDGEFNLGQWRGGSALLNQRVTRLGASVSDVDRRYLARFLPIALKRVEDETPYVTVKHLSAKVLRAIEVPLPSLHEQCRIAAILDRADALRAKRRQVLTTFESLRQSVFIDMFGDPASNPHGLATGTVKDLVESADYGTSEKSSQGGDIAVLRMNNITYGGEIDLRDLKYMDLSTDKYDRYTVRKGDVLFNRTNSAELVGKTAVYHGSAPLAYAGYLVRLRVREGFSPDYLSGVLNSAYGKATLRGMCKSIVGMANINAKEVQTIRTLIPPASDQQKYSEHIEALRVAKDRQATALAELDELFTSLQSRAFRGEL